MGKTQIEWTDATWNPIRGTTGRWHCTHVSEGCRNCYAERLNVRWGGPVYKPGADTFRLDKKVLEQPLRWKKPRKIFVCDMTDLFHEDIPAEWIVQVFAIIEACPQHIWQLLTKRPQRIEPVLYGQEGGFYLGGGDWWPNVWMGFSAEDQTTFDERMAVFDVREGERVAWSYALNLWCSLEPLLGPIQLGSWLARLKWCVVGGESGPNARPCDLAWIRSLRDQCQHAKVPVFIKQFGANIRASGQDLCEWPIKTAPGLSHDTTYHPPRVFVRHRKGGDPAEWPTDLRVREFPHVI